MLVKVLSYRFSFKYLLVFLQLSLSVPGIIAQAPVIKIDFNQSGRDVNQVSQLGYEAWDLYENPATKTYQGVTFSISKFGDIGSGLKSTWYKGGINTAKLVSDGLTVIDGNDGAAILLTLRNLPEGENSLLVYLNNIDNPKTQTFCPLDILINNELVEDDIQPTTRAVSNYEAKIVYLKFNAVKYTDVNILFKADVLKGAIANNKNVIINAIELNTPNLLEQAKEPFPQDHDEHVIAKEDNSVTLKWIANPKACSHDVYFSNNIESVISAQKSDEAYKGNMKETSFDVSGLDSHLTYYWRIDEVKEDGSVTKGEIWSFRIAQLAFLGAEGYGRFARGGRDGKVVHVTNLNDSGEGSLRYAIEIEKGPRTIVFDVSGIIQLQSRLTLSDSKVTIAGQTAPGKGICIKNAPLGLSGAEDVIIQNIRVRRGSEGDYNWGLDGMGMQGSNNCIIDHCSISWTIDEAFSSRSGQNISLQRTLISEALNVAGHPNYPEGTKHGYAGSIGGDIGSFHHNLLAHCEGRNWSLAGGLDGNAYYAGRLDIRNNVVYNWGHRATDGGAKEVNFVGNYYKPGAATNFFYALNMQHEGTGLGMQRAFFKGNVMPGYFDEDDQEKGRKFTISNNANVDWETFVKEPFFASYVNTQSAIAAYKDVISDVGCINPVSDDHDLRIIEETLKGSYSIKGSKSGKPGLPDDQSDVGGYENYPVEIRSSDWDSDGDGLPNWWEEAFHLNINSAKNDFSDTNNDEDGDGYTQMEEYLNWMNKLHYFSSVKDKLVIHLKALFKGYEKTPHYSVVNADNGKINIKKDQAKISASTKGFASFTIKVVDAEGDSKEREVVVYFK